MKSFTINQSRLPITAYCSTFAIVAGFVVAVLLLVLMSIANRAFTPFFATTMLAGAR